MSDVILSWSESSIASVASVASVASFEVACLASSCDDCSIVDAALSTI